MMTLSLECEGQSRGKKKLRNLKRLIIFVKNLVTYDMAHNERLGGHEVNFKAHFRVIISFY